MDDKLGLHLEKMLQAYTKSEYWDTLMGAKKLYTQLTGSLTDEDKGFESRMNAFNDWYLFNYPYVEGMPLSKIYCSTNDLTEDLDTTLSSVMYSLFEYEKNNYKEEMVLKDILHNQTFTLKDKSVGVVEKDIFTGRLVSYQGEYYLLSGVCIVPTSVRRILKKYSRRVRKLKNLEEECNFLYKIESLSTKAGRYNHVDPAKFFVLD